MFGLDVLDLFGFDLLVLFIGLEGMFGVIIEVMVKLLLKLFVVWVLLVSFDLVEKVGFVVGDIIVNGIIFGGLEMMDNLLICVVEDFIYVGYFVDVEVILLCELDGVEFDVQEDCEWVNDILLKVGVIDVCLVQDEVECVCFWVGCKNVFLVVGCIFLDYYCMDGIILCCVLFGVLEGIVCLLQ